jgi:hypothetical protein
VSLLAEYAYLVGIWLIRWSAKHIKDSTITVTLVER